MSFFIRRWEAGGGEGARARARIVAESEASPFVTAAGVGIPGTFIQFLSLHATRGLREVESVARIPELGQDGHRERGEARTARLAPRHSTRLFDLCSRNCWFKRFCTVSQLVARRRCDGAAIQSQTLRYDTQAQYKAFPGLSIYVRSSAKKTSEYVLPNFLTLL